jgi:sec-independent protein translocase protein TatB
MFDIGFSELLIIAVVALLVVGPERLPKLARTAGHMLGKLQRYVNQVKTDIKHEMAMEELEKVRKSMASAAADVEYEIREAAGNTQRVMDAMAKTAAAPVEEIKSAAEAIPPPDRIEGAENDQESGTVQGTADDRPQDRIAN